MGYQKWNLLNRLRNVETKMAKVRVTQLKSLIGRKKNHRLSIKGLGLKGIGDTSILEDTPSVRGMINQVSYMISVEEVK